MSVHLKCCFRDKSSKNSNKVILFLDLLELARTDASTITSAIYKCLATWGFCDEYLSSHWICITTDGASVMLGKNSEVATMVSHKLPRVIAWHCANHRLELAVGDSMDTFATDGVNNFRIFVDALYNLYHASSKNEGELQNCARELGQCIQKVGRVLDTRWVASSLRSVNAVWNSFDSLACHLLDASKDTSRSEKKRSKYSGIHKTLVSPQFLCNLALMKDTLKELSLLSLSLQRDDINLATSHTLVKNTLSSILAMKATNSPSV